MAKNSTLTSEDFKIKFINQLALKPSWANSLDSSVASFVQDYIGNVGESIVGIINQAINNFLLSDQLSTEGIYRVARFVGYIPDQYTSARGVVTFTFTESGGLQETIIIPAGFKLKSVKGIPYVVLVDTQVNAGEIEADVLVIQGESQELIFASNGGVYQTFNINPYQIDRSTFLVTVVESPDETVYTEISSFRIAARDDIVYILRVLSDGVMIKFGDGGRGNIPELGASIIVTFIDSLGPGGNIGIIGNLNTAVDSLEYISTDPVLFTVANEATIVGGDDPESEIETLLGIKTALRTTDVIGRTSGYRDFIKTLPSVLDCIVWGQDEVGESNADFGVANISIIGEGYVFFTDTQKGIVVEEPDLPPPEGSVMAELLEVKEFIARINFEDATRISVNFTISFTVPTGGVLTDFQTNILDLIRNYFPLTAADLGTLNIFRDLDISDLNELILATYPTIKNLVNIVNIRDEFAISSSAGSISGALLHTNVEFFEVWLDTGSGYNKITHYSTYEGVVDDDPAYVLVIDLGNNLYQVTGNFLEGDDVRLVYGPIQETRLQRVLFNSFFDYDLTNTTVAASFE